MRDVHLRGGASFVYFLNITRSEPASGAAIPVATRSPAADRAAVNGIRCKSALENRPYITADGTISACCWISESPDEARLHAQAGFDLESRNIHRNDLQTMLYQEPGSLLIHWFCVPSFRKMKCSG